MLALCAHASVEIVAEWFDYCQSGKKPADIPPKPAEPMREDGLGLDWDWLGTRRVADELTRVLVLRESTRVRCAASV